MAKGEMYRMEHFGLKLQSDDDIYLVVHYPLSTFSLKLHLFEKESYQVNLGVVQHMLRSLTD